MKKTRDHKVQERECWLQQIKEVHKWCQSRRYKKFVIFISKSILKLNSVQSQVIVIIKDSKQRREQIKLANHGKMLISFSMMNKQAVVRVRRKPLQMAKLFQIVMLLVAKLNVTKIKIVERMKLNQSASYSQINLMVLINGKETKSHYAMGVLLKMQISSKMEKLSKYTKVGIVQIMINLTVMQKL